MVDLLENLPVAHTGRVSVCHASGPMTRDRKGVRSSWKGLVGKGLVGGFVGDARNKRGKRSRLVDSEVVRARYEGRRRGMRPAASNPGRCAKTVEAKYKVIEFCRPLRGFSVCMSGVPSVNRVGRSVCRYVISLSTAIEVSDSINFDSCQAEDQRDVNRGQHIPFFQSIQSHTMEQFLSCRVWACIVLHFESGCTKVLSRTTRQSVSTVATLHGLICEERTHATFRKIIDLSFLVSFSTNN